MVDIINTDTFKNQRQQHIVSTSTSVRYMLLFIAVFTLMIVIALIPLYLPKKGISMNNQQGKYPLIIDKLFLTLKNCILYCIVYFRFFLSTS